MKNIQECKALNESIIQRKAANGLRVYILPKKDYNKQFAVLGVSYGSIDNKFSYGKAQSISVPDGIAHFLEHKLFETEQGSAFDAFYERGAQPNAFTSFTNTSYHFTCTNQFFDCLEILVSMVINPNFSDEGIKKEKEIISQEIRMYQDDPHWRMYFNLMRGLYQKHPVRREIAGTVESIQEIDRDLLVSCHQAFYTPDNMILFLAGDFRMEEIDEQLKSLEIKNDSGRQKKVNRIYPAESSLVHKHEVKDKMPISSNMFALGFKGKKEDDPDEILSLKVKMDILLDLLVGKSSDLYSLLYNCGAIDASFEASFICEKEFNHVILSGRTPDYKKTIAMIHSEIDKRRSDPWTSESFIRSRNKLLGNFIRDFNSMENIGQQFIYMALNEIHLLDYMEKLQNITCEDAYFLFKEYFLKDHATLSIIESTVKK